MVSKAEKVETKFTNPKLIRNACFWYAVMYKASKCVIKVKIIQGNQVTQVQQDKYTLDPGNSTIQKFK